MLNNIAVLIDGDNASAKNIDAILQAIEKLGKISTKKIYGDWSLSGLSASWQDAILRHAIDPMQQFAYVKGKNATDIALVIEAMDLLHSGEYDGFCLVSSDSDFASLAVRIRKSGIKVFGFGRQEAVMSFRQACDEFFEVERLVQNAIQNKPVSKLSKAQLQKETKLVNALNKVIADLANFNDDNWSDYKEVLIHFNKKYPNINHEQYGYEKLIHLIKAIDLFEIKNDETNATKLFVKSKQPIKYTTGQLQSQKEFIQAIKEIIDNSKDNDGWCNLGTVSVQLSQNYQIDVKKYGYKKFSDLITAIRLFDIQKRQNGIYIKVKNTPSKTKPAPQHIPNNTTDKADTITNITTPNTAPPNPVLKGQIDVYVYAPNALDVVLWRLGSNKKVRHDGDMIFYGQTHSEDGTLHLDINEIFHSFSCHLAHQSDDVRHMIFTISHETDSISHPTPLCMVIEQAEQKVFDYELLLDDSEAKSALFLELFRTELGWRVVPRRQMIKNDLAELCQVLGVEVE